MKLSEVKELKDAGKFKEALLWLHAFESQHQDDPVIMKMVNEWLAESYVRLDNILEGERYYRKLVEADPEDAITWCTIETLDRKSTRLNSSHRL